MKVSRLESTSINLLKKFLSEHTDEVFTVVELKQYGFNFKSDELARRIGDDYTYKCTKYRVFGDPKVIKEIKDKRI